MTMMTMPDENNDKKAANDDDDADGDADSDLIIITDANE